MDGIVLRQSRRASSTINPKWSPSILMMMPCLFLARQVGISIFLAFCFSAGCTLAAAQSWPFVDTFNRAACTVNCGNGGDIGSNYTQFASPYAVSSNPLTLASDAVTMSSWAGSYGSFMSGAVLTETEYTFTANQYAQVEIQTGGTGSQNMVMLIVHYKDANNFNYINFQGNPMLFTVVNGAATWIGNYNDNVTAGHVYRVEVIGNNYQVFDNGISAGTLSTTANSSAGPTGIGISGYTATPGSLINFQTNNCTSTCPADNGAAAATPTFSPGAGTYTSPQSVTISDSIPGATIYYTTDGSTPTSSSSVYSGPINVSSSETVRAIATASGYSQSATASATYTIAGQASWPFIDSFGRAGCTTNCGNGGSLGPNYTEFYSPSTNPSGSVTLISNAASMSAWSGSSTSILSGAVLTEAGYTFTANQYAQIQVQSPGTKFMLILHYQDSNNYNYIDFQGSPSLNTVSNGEASWIGSYSGGVTAGHIYRVEVIGNSYQVFDNGVSDGTLTTTTNPAAGPTGIGIGGYTDTPSSLVNFQTDNCTSTCPADNGTPAATPTFSPAAGTYTSIQSVTISDATPGATIYYTTDGSTPTTGSAVYSSPVTVSASGTVSAIAVASGYYQSSVGAAPYVINLPLAATPQFGPGGGTYTSAQTVTLSDSTPGARIYYTTDGSTPTTNSTVYSSPINVSSSETLVAIAVASGYNQSATGSASYAIQYSAAEPTISPSAGTYSTAQTVTISDSTPGATIYYTTNGTAPTPSSTTYTGPINVGATETVEAIASGGGYSQSPTASAAYTILITAPPTFSPAAGSYTTPQTVTISDSTPDAAIYYTTDGSTPTTSSAVYSSPITVSTTETLRAIAVASGYSQSSTVSAAYAIQVATPTFSPGAGTYPTAQTVTISDSTAGTTIYYTTDGSTPTTSSAVYSSPITVSSSETLKAIATASGYSQSAVASAPYTIGALTNGTYMIVNLASGMALDGGGAGTSKGTWVLQDSSSGGANQQWIVTALSSNTYSIVSVANGLALDDYGDGTTNGTEVDVYTNTAQGNSGQIWYLTATSNGYYTLATQDIVKAGVNSCIEPSGGSTASGAQIVINNGCDSPATAQQWQFVPVTTAPPPVANGTYEIQNLASGMVLDGGGSGTSKGTWVTQDASTNGTNQAWTLTSSGNAYTIVSVANGLSLDDYADGTANGTEIDVYTNTANQGNTGQIWYLTPTGNGYYTLASQDIATAGVASCIEPSNGSSASGAEIVIYNGCNTPASAQQWTFVAVSNLAAAPGTPTFNPGAGSYNIQTSVTISDSTPGATIYYTTDGSTPTTGSAVYNGPINVTTSETLNAMATAPGYTQQSAVGTAAYTITHIATTPTFSPVEGTYGSEQSVTISESTSGATIYYTTDGTTPTTDSAVYTSPIDVSASETIQAMATSSGYTSSPVASATYTITTGAAGYCAAMSLGDSPHGTANLNGMVPFPPTNAWNVDITNAPVDPNNPTIQSAPGYAGLATHVSFGSAPSDGGIPFMIVDSSTTPMTPINVIDYPTNSDVVVAPYPNNVPIEGNAADCSGWPDTWITDSHTLVLDRRSCWLYETYQTNRCNGKYNAAQETIWDMTNGEMRPWGWTSADVAGLSVFAGLVRYDEAASGHINHAIRMTMQQTKNDPNNGYFVEPATHAWGTYDGSPSVQGMRVRLKSSFDISGYSPINQAILRAMQQYGMIVADNGGSFFIQGATDSRWNDSDLAQLGGIPSSEFDVIQMSPAYPGWDSATHPEGPAPTINSFTASDTEVSSGSPVTFNFNVSNDSYDYIDVIGPVRTTGGSGSVTINPTATEQYILYSTNQYGRSSSTPIIVTVPGSTIATPTFDEPAGTYTGSVSVVISTSTYPFAQIYYTTDGSEPTTGSTLYKNPITVSGSETIKAIAVVPGYSEPSAVGSASYTIN